MPQAPSISDAEWQVMTVAWERAPVTAADVVEALAEKRSWSPRTIKTLLGRLLRKGALGHRVEGNRYVYFPRIARDACVRRESRWFLERVFDGDALSAMVYLAKAGNLSDRQLRELRRLLESEPRQSKESEE